MSQRHCMIIPVAMAAICNQVAHTIGTDPEGKLDTFTSTHEDAEGGQYCMRDGILSPDPQEWEARRLALETGFSGGQLAGAKWWRWYDSGPLRGQLVRSYLGDAETHVGEPWSVEQCVSAAGLTPIQTID